MMMSQSGARLKEGMNPPTLFPCANRVKMPHVGADTLDPKASTNTPPGKTSQRSKSSPISVPTAYLKKISSDLTFSEDVVKQRCFHTLPYSDKYFYEALDISDLIPRPPKAKVLVGRHNPRGKDQKHMPCHIQKRTTHKLKPMKRKILEKALQMHQDALMKDLEQAREDELTASEESQTKEVFLTQTLQESKPKAAKSKRDWDEYVVSILSQTTAQWLVTRRMSGSDPRAQQLSAYLQECYGPPDPEVEIVRDDISEGDTTARGDETRRGKWKSGEDTLLDQIREKVLADGKPTDPYSDDNAAAFYRLPAGFRRAKKHQDKEEAGAINTTAYNIEVKTYQPPPPPTLRDYMNPGVGEKVYHTDNLFQDDWLTGAMQLHQKFEDPTKILMDSQNKYRKVLQKMSPRQPELWFPQTEEERKKKQKSVKKVRQLEKGLHRWKALPESIDDTAEKLNLLPPGHDPEFQRSPDPNSRRQVRTNNTLTHIVSDWRNKWNLDMRYADATPEDLIRDMADNHVHIRLKAVATCARAAEYRPPPEPGIQLDAAEKQVNQVALLPAKLFLALECLLDDEHEQVRRAAAITLYTLEKPVPKAEDILRKTLKEARSVDRWAAAQCLAYYGECDSEIVGELVQQLLNSEDKIRHEQAAFLLARLSENSTLVHSMLGEQLNSSSWRHRVIACKSFPKLAGNINKDLVHKLTHLMWDDWHAEVRKASAQTLGKTGHGKDVHDELKHKILHGNERSRVEAVSKVGYLGIMTAKLLPAYLACFHDSYVSVRMEVCIACSNLRIKEESVLEKLVYLATFDPIWRVKAMAIQALGEIGAELTSEIRECILWALRYETEPGVRAEACNSLVKLGIKGEDVIQILQDRFLVESTDIVRQEIIRALENFGISPTEDMDMVAQIKGEVRKLCTRNNICAHITVNERAETKRQNMQRMIVKPTLEKKPEVPRQLSTSRQGGARPRLVVTPDTSTYGREMAVTPTVDQEIQAIMSRADTHDQLTTPVTSRSASGTPHTKSRQTDYSSYTSEETSDSEYSGPRDTPVTPHTPLEDVPEESQNQTVPQDATDEKTEGSGTGQLGDDGQRVLGDSQTYVEVSDRPQQDSDMANVVNVQHVSPKTSMTNMMESKQQPELQSIKESEDEGTEETPKDNNIDGNENKKEN